MQCLRKILFRQIENFREIQINQHGKTNCGWIYIVRCAGWKENVYKFGISIKEPFNQRFANYQQSGFQNAEVISLYFCDDALKIENHLKLHLFGFHMDHSLETVCMPLEVLKQTV